MIGFDTSAAFLLIFRPPRTFYFASPTPLTLVILARISEERGEIRQRQFVDEEPRHLSVGDFETEGVEEDSNPSSAVDSSSLYPDQFLTTALYPEYPKVTIFASVTVLFSRFARSGCYPSLLLPF